MGQAELASDHVSDPHDETAAAATRIRYAVLAVGCGLSLLTYIHRQSFVRAHPEIGHALGLEQRAVWLSASRLPDRIRPVPSALRARRRSAGGTAPVDVSRARLVAHDGTDGAWPAFFRPRRRTVRLLAGRTVFVWRVSSGILPGLVPRDDRLDAHHRTGVRPGDRLDVQPARRSGRSLPVPGAVRSVRHVDHAVLALGRLGSARRRSVLALVSQ